jgi:hypothetical protein
MKTLVNVSDVVLVVVVEVLVSEAHQVWKEVSEVHQAWEEVSWA